MRDIAYSLLLFGLIPVIFRYPWIGVLASVWVSIFTIRGWMFGFAYNLPGAMILAVVTVLAMLMKPAQVRFPVTGITILLILLPLWMTVTLVFALEPDAAYVQWVRVMKMFILVFISAALLHSRKQLEAMLWVIVLSIGFYGVKGGMYTLRGGDGQVWGPPGDSIISDNNALAVVLIMIIPLMQYLAGVAPSKWVRRGLFGAMFLCGIAVLGSQSRGAFLAVLVTLAFFWLKSQKKLILGLLLLVAVPLAIGFMSEKWTSRMQTIENYQEDESARGRLNAWQMAINIANRRPLVGGGFEPYSRNVYSMYAPDPNSVAAAHSIYFTMLGEHGYVGLALFLGLGIASWRLAGRTISVSRNRSDYVWASDLARAIQVSLIGYAVGGAFLQVAYWEMFYYEIVILVAAYRLASAVEPSPGRDGMQRKPDLPHAPGAIKTGNR